MCSIDPQKNGPGDPSATKNVEVGFRGKRFFEQGPAQNVCSVPAKN